MKIKSLYFPHDFFARHDPKLERLRAELGCEGIGIYWCLIEMLYEQGGSLKIADLGLYAKMLNITEEKLNHTLGIPNLFRKNSSHIYSLSQQNRLRHINNRSDKARNSANTRWNANAMRTQCERNAIKEDKNITNKNKEKQRKEKTTISLFSESNKIVDHLYKRILENKPDFKIPAGQHCLIEADRMIRIDKRNPDTIIKIIDFATSDDFWKTNILSVNKLRKQFDKLELQANKSKSNLIKKW